jgi:hypothetical protein
MPLRMTSSAAPLGCLSVASLRTQYEANVGLAQSHAVAFKAGAIKRFYMARGTDPTVISIVKIDRLHSPTSSRQLDFATQEET